MRDGEATKTYSPSTRMPSPANACTCGWVSLFAHTHTHVASSCMCESKAFSVSDAGLKMLETEMSTIVAGQERLRSESTHERSHILKVCAVDGYNRASFEGRQRNGWARNTQRSCLFGVWGFRFGVEVFNKTPGCYLRGQF